jgi:MEMO1 family protein
MPSIRSAAVAGMFYPGAPQELESTVRRLLAEAKPASGPVPKAIIAPHAGYVYSGAVAASAYAQVRPAADRIRRIVLLGPCHRVPVRGVAATGADSFATPLGTVPVDREAIDRLLALPQVHVLDASHAQEHSLEVHLPFLQVIFDDFAVVPLVVGDAAHEEVAQVIDAIWGGPETLIVVSSDLSHYEDYATAQRMDAATCRAIEALDANALGYEQACGRVPVGGLLTAAKRRGLKVKTVDLRNSGDTAGPRDRVVGYGSWIFWEPDAASKKEDERRATTENAFGDKTHALLERHGSTLLHLAAASIECGLENSRPLPVSLAEYPEDLRAKGACFVTLKHDGKLRGCIGTAVARRPLVVDVVENAFSAAFKDPRFPPLTASETEGLEVSLSVLSTHWPMTFRDEKDLLRQLRPGVDGLVIEDAGRRALFLPAVWESLPDAESFVGHLKLKAGLLRGHWSGGFKAWRFVAEETSSSALEDPASLWSQTRQYH